MNAQKSPESMSTEELEWEQGRWRMRESWRRGQAKHNPRWEHWLGNLAPALWELVALAMNVEPIFPLRIVQFRTDSEQLPDHSCLNEEGWIQWKSKSAEERNVEPWHSTSVKGLPLLECLREDIHFQRLLAVGESWLLTKKLLRCDAESDVAACMARVERNEFVRVATAHGWLLPEQLRPAEAVRKLKAEHAWIAVIDGAVAAAFPGPLSAYRPRGPQRDPVKRAGLQPLVQAGESPGVVKKAWESYRKSPEGMKRLKGYGAIPAKVSKA